jgi:peptidyl-prolyl cis-trans isomerase D
MAVMENIRSTASNPWMKAVFAAIVLVFVFWGVGGAGGPTNQVIAEVNGKRITDTDFQRLMRNISRNRGEAKSDEEQKRVAQQTVAQLIEMEVLIQAALENGVEVSSDEIARYVLQIDGFKDSGGLFSDTLYRKNLKRMGMTQGRFEDQIRTQLKLEKLSDLSWQGVQISDGQVRRQYNQAQTKASLRLVRIPDSNLIDDVTVDDASIAAFVENNEGDIRARYEADFKRLYKKSRRVKLSQIIINPDVESDQGARVTIDSVLAQARSGADFAELARTHSHDLSAANGGDVGVMAEEQLSPSIAAAVFATAVGGITEVVTQNDGLFIAKVEEIIPAETTEFDTVKEEIARTITSEKGVGAISQAYAERVLADWTTNGTPSTEILAEQSVFSMDTPPFPIGAPNFPGLSDSPALIKALNTADGPVVFSTIFPVPGGRIIAELTQLDRPTDADFERDKDSIRRRLEAMARNEWVAAWKNDLVARADVRQHWHP